MLVRKKISKEDVDYKLLKSIFSLEAQWKQMQMIMENSYDTYNLAENKLLFQLKQAKYMYLLQEAKHRNIRASRY